MTNSGGKEQMGPTQHYEIFQKLPSKQAVWVETAIDLGDAKKRLGELEQMFPADYFILDLENSVCIMPFDIKRKWLDLLF